MASAVSWALSATAFDIYEEKENRGFVKLEIVTVLLTIAMIVCLALCVSLVAAIPTALAIFSVSEFWKSTTMLIRWPMMFLLGAVGIAVLYRSAPSRRDARWTWLSLGATLACLLWVVANVAQ